MASQNRKTLDLALKALADLDIEPLGALIDDTPDTFTQRFFPASLKGRHPDVRNKQEYLDHLASIKGRFGPLNIEVLDTVEAADAIVIHLKGNGSLADGRPYNNEYVFTVRFNDEGKITSIREFIDSAYLLSVLPRTVT